MGSLYNKYNQDMKERTHLNSYKNNHEKSTKFKKTTYLILKYSVADHYLSSIEYNVSNKEWSNLKFIFFKTPIKSEYWYKKIFILDKNRIIKTSNSWFPSSSRFSDI